ncbi:MAG: glycosyltransferase [Bacteroidota bacterium]
MYSSVEILSENCTTFEERTNDIFIVGTISAEKGFNTILQALQLLHAKSISLNVAIAGSFCNAEYKELVKNYIENSGMKHRITFLNSITNVRDIMLQSKILVHASLRESFGRVLIEAMACKTPVIASKIGGIPEIIKSGVTGVLFDVGNAEMLTDDVLKLLQNENLWNLISENGYQFVRQNFNHDIFSSQLDKIISYSLIKY